MEHIAPGIWKIRIGEPEVITPVNMRSYEVRAEELEKLEKNIRKPFECSCIKYKETARGLCIEIPLEAEERIYGFGLQLKSFNQTGRKKHLRTNADPVADTGDSHAPVPFYVSTMGYGVLVDTLRHVSFYCGSSVKKATRKKDSEEGKAEIANNTDELYKVSDKRLKGTMIIEVPNVKGADIYIFGGPDMKSAVQRYNLFSGGGFLPPLWGLGVIYRAYAKADKKDVLGIAEEFRKDGIPCDMLGLEPGWQSHAYSCSYTWDRERFSGPEEFISQLRAMNYNINLWEHAFVHPASPLYKDLVEHSCDYEVWNGIVPDLFEEEAREIFAEYHGKELTGKGISGFKLDECDGSDLTGGWSFPDCAQFPSGMDGEQMHSAFGMLYQKTILSTFSGNAMRTYGQVRSSHALAAPLPFVLYSDLYNHADYIRGMASMGFSGLLWTPEVRQCSSVEDLIRRVETVVFSPQTCINAWMIPHPPWKQFDYDKNLKGEFLDNYKEVQEKCGKLLKLRMQLIPYLYTSFMRYYLEGIPPFRPLVMDYPDDNNVYEIYDQYMVGGSILVAPVTEGLETRGVYLPEGTWYSYWTAEKYEGGKHYDIRVKETDIPVFVKDCSLIPLARPLEFITKDTCFEIDVKIFGDGSCVFDLYEDDGITLDYQKGCCNTVQLKYTGNCTGEVNRSGSYDGRRYEIKSWEKCGGSPAVNL